MDTKKITVIGMILFIIISLWTFSNVINGITGEYSTFNFLDVVNILTLAAFVMAVVVLASKKNNKLVIILAAILAATDLYWFISGFTNYSYSVYDYSYYSWDSNYEFNIFCLLPALLELVAFVALLMLALSQYTNIFLEKQELFKKLWFVPGAAYAATIPLAGIVYLITGGDWSGWYSYLYYGPMVFIILAAVAMIFLGMYVAHPNGLSKGTPNATPNADETLKAAPAGDNVEGYCGIVKHILLLFFTFGVWWCIWIYKTTNFLNKDTAEPARSATSQLLLCLFVPFYIIYWTYKSAQRIDRLAARNAVASDMAVLCLILAIFVSIVPPILMQDKMNNIVTAHGFIGGANVKKPTPAPAPESNAQQPEAPKAEPAAEIDAAKVAAELKAYKELLDAGIISKEEFEAKKKQLLNS